uniref:Uncharacterized protein n=1 Tax=Oryza sativa subsp. japonica TaxID=39947 RepID=Q69MK5_ORYSJ|nr:hypothetical protein [Oryza sativa Japonica Group]
MGGDTTARRDRNDGTARRGVARARGVAAAAARLEAAMERARGDGMATATARQWWRAARGGDGMHARRGAGRDSDGAAAAMRWRWRRWRGGRRRGRRCAAAGDEREGKRGGAGLGDRVEHLRCNEQCRFLINPILVYFPYKFDSTIPNFAYMHFTQ